jgi:HSP20 family molecular chaperone IbpA
MNESGPSPMAKTVKIVPVSSAEQGRRIEQHIARRAYEIFEKRGGMGWHELEDWRQAESEVRSKLFIALTRSDDSLLASCSLADLEEGTVEVWTAARQMTISGRPIHDKERARKAAPWYKGTVFRTMTLPAAVEPGQALAYVKSGFVQVRLPLVRTRCEGRSRAQRA